MKKLFFNSKNKKNCSDCAFQDEDSFCWIKNDNRSKSCFHFKNKILTVSAENRLKSYTNKFNRIFIGYSVIFSAISFPLSIISLFIQF